MQGGAGSDRGETAPGLGGSGHVLLVEDQSSVRTVLRTILRHSGYEVTEAADGVEALERIRETPPDAVVTDIVMPRLDGLELVGQLRRSRPDIPVVFISGYANPQVAEACRQLPNAEFLPKPFGREDLLQALSKVLRK